jgi:hypothetical protein
MSSSLKGMQHIVTCIPGARQRPLNKRCTTAVAGQQITLTIIEEDQMVFPKRYARRGYK